MAFLFLTTRMRRHTEGLERLEVQARTVREALEQAEQRYPGLTNDLFEGRDLHEGILIAIDDTVVDNPLTVRLQPDSEIYIIPAMSGG